MSGSLQTSKGMGRFYWWRGGGDPHCPRRPRAPPRSNFRLLFAAHLRCSTTPPHKKIPECPSSQWDASAMLRMAGVKRPAVEKKDKKTKASVFCSRYLCIAQPDAAHTKTCERESFFPFSADPDTPCLVVKLILWVGVNARPRTPLEDAHVRVPVSLVRSCVVHLFIFVFVYSVGSIGGV